MVDSRVDLVTVSGVAKYLCSNGREVELWKTAVTCRDHKSCGQHAERYFLGCEVLQAQRVVVM